MKLALMRYTEPYDDMIVFESLGLGVIATECHDLSSFSYQCPAINRS